MKPILNIINQVFELEKKLTGATNVQRNLERIKAELAEMGYDYKVPLHEKWDDTRTDCEANIAGALRSKMTITEVVKPIVFYKQNGERKLVQKGIVVVE